MVNHTVARSLRKQPVIRTEDCQSAPKCRLTLPIRFVRRFKKRLVNHTEIRSWPEVRW
jgi:hypothetical protein